MTKLDVAARAALRPGETPLRSFQGLSDGLNRSLWQPGPAIMHVTGSSVVVAWTKPSPLSKAQCERFETADLMDVVEADLPLPGMVGALERKNATHAVARAFGASNTRPTITVVTCRGDFSLFFDGKHRGMAREALIAVGGLIRR